MKSKNSIYKQNSFIIFFATVGFFFIGLFAANYTIYAKDISNTQAYETKSYVNFEDGFANLANNLLPTVVNVSTTTKVETRKMPKMPNFSPNSPFEDMFRDFFEQHENDKNDGSNSDQIPQREVSALGSGFVIDAEKGYIVTNNHVIDGADDIKVILYDDTSLDAILIGKDKKTDLAVLQIKTPHKLVAVKWGDSKTARVGNWVMAIGNPFGLGGTVTAGIISARQRNINAGPYDDFIQTDASINRGNSGGPMFNVKGEVIGVNTAIFSPTGGSIGIGFAVPSNLAKNVVKQLIQYGKTKRGWLGVRIQNVTDDIAASLDMKKKTGALVSSVAETSPAAKGKIKAGDVILEFDGKEVTEMRQLPRIVAETDVGKTVKILLWRKGRETTVKVMLGELEKAEDDGLVSSRVVVTDNKVVNDVELKEFGFSVAIIDDSLRKQHGFDKSVSGVVITKVMAVGAAKDKGLHKGDIIVEAGQKIIKTTKDLQKVLKLALKQKKTSVLFLISRKDNLRFVGLRLKTAKNE